MLRVPSSTRSSRSLNSRRSQTLTARKLRLLVLADANAFRVVAVGAERRRAGGADPLLAALMAALLLLHALAQGLEQLVETAHGLDLLLLFLGEVFFGELPEPLGRDFGGGRLAHQLEALEHVTEDAVELVEIALVLDQRRPRQIIEVLDPAAGEVLLHRLHQREILAQRYRHAGGFELVEERDEHGASSRHRSEWSRPDSPRSGGSRGAEAIDRDAIDVADELARARFPRATEGESAAGLARDVQGAHAGDAQVLVRARPRDPDQ